MSAFVSLLPPAFLDPIKSVLNGVISQGNATLIALHASDHPAALAAVSVITNTFVVAYYNSVVGLLSKIWLPLILVFFRLYVVPYFRPEAAAPVAVAPRRTTAVADFKPAASSTTATEAPATKSRKAKK